MIAQYRVLWQGRVWGRAATRAELQCLLRRAPKGATWERVW